MKLKQVDEMPTAGEFIAVWTDSKGLLRSNSFYANCESGEVEINTDPGHKVLLKTDEIDICFFIKERK